VDSFFFFFFLVVVLEIKLRAVSLLGKCSSTVLQPLDPGLTALKYKGGGQIEHPAPGSGIWSKG
jgi:hypothetical protein